MNLSFLEKPSFLYQFYLREFLLPRSCRKNPSARQLELRDLNIRILGDRFP